MQKERMVKKILKIKTKKEVNNKSENTEKDGNNKIISQQTQNNYFNQYNTQ